MLFSIHRYLRKAIAVPDSESGTTSYEEFTPSANSEKTTHVLDHPPLVSSKTGREYWKLRFAIKFIFLAFSFAFLFFFGPAIKDHATLVYNGMLRNSKANEQATCGQDISLQNPIGISAGPVTDDPVKAEKIKDRKAWVAECSSNTNDCKLAIDEAGDDTFWQSQGAPPNGGHWVVINLQNKENIHSLAVRPSQEWKQNGGAPQKHRVEVSADKTNWQLVAFGTWRDIGGGKQNYTLSLR